MYGPGGVRWTVRVGGDEGTFDAKYLKYSTVRYIIVRYIIVLLITEFINEYLYKCISVSVYKCIVFKCISV